MNYSKMAVLKFYTEERTKTPVDEFADIKQATGLSLS